MTDESSRGSETSVRVSDRTGANGETSSEHSSDETSPEREPRRGPPPNPLYHPLFLPVLLVAYCLWFGYDGFFQGPEYEHRTFNRVMFGLTAALSVWVVPRGIREFRADRAQAAQGQSGRSSSE